MKLFDILKQFTNKVKPDASAKKNSLLVKIENETLQRVKQTIERWRYAVYSAEDVNMYRRTELYRLYKDLDTDQHLQAAIDLKKDRLQAIQFAIYNQDGSVNELATDKFNARWFYNLISIFVDTMFWGHSLIQIDEIYEKDISLTLIPRQNVKPEYREYLVNYNDMRGESYTDDKTYNWLIEIGSSTSLGNYASLTPLLLYKKFALQFWAEFQELFGTPLRIGKTKSSIPDERNRFVQFLKDMGSSSFAVLSEGEDVEFVESKTSDSFSVYLEFLKFINSEISKKVLGAVEMIDGSTGGSEARAKVHNLQADYKTRSELRELKFFINDIVIPKLATLGFVESGVYFNFDDNEVLSIIDKVKVDKTITEIVQSGVFSKEYIESRYNVELSDSNDSNDINDSNETE